VAERRADLIRTRRQLRAHHLAHMGANSEDDFPRWLQGIDALSPGSYDVLTVTILYPT
jgi:hypothetical protein